MSRVRILLAGLLFTIFFSINLNAASYGFDTTTSIVNPFNITGPDNIIRTFGCVTNGFAFTDASTTCSFNSVFPIAGPITFKGGTLWLQKDLILTNTGSFVDLGRIKGQSHAIDLPASLTSFYGGTQQSGATILSLVARITATRTIFSVDWSYDNKYVAFGIASGAGADLYVYEFTGTTLIFRASINLATNGFSVRWRPNSYHIAIAGGSTIRTYTFTPPSSLNFADSQAPGGTYNAVGWQGRGAYLAAAGSAVAVYTVNPSTAVMSSLVTPTNNSVLNGTVGNNILKWAPTGNKNDLIIGTSGGSLHLYNFDGTLLNHLKNYPQGTAITSLDWARTSTYMAIGFSNGNIKTYQHSAASNTIGLKATLTTASNTSANALSWSPDAKNLVAGFALSATYNEFQLFSFNSLSSSYVLSNIYGINLTTGVNAARYSPSGSYIARGDPTTNYFSIYGVSFSPFIFEDVKLYLSGDVTLGSPLTFKGSCLLNTRSNLLTCTGSGTINVAQNSTLDIAQTNLNFTTPRTFALQGGTSNVNFRNTSISLNTDVLWGDGKFDNYGNLIITGPHTFDYESGFTSTIHSNATLTFQNDSIFKIGKANLQATDPLAFEDNSAQLNFDNATFNVTNSGLKLTKGIINVYNQTNFVVDNTDNTQSCSLILGDKAKGSSYDLNLRLHGNGTALTLKNGPVVLDSISPYKNEFLGQSRVILENSSSVGIRRPVDISNGWISVADGTTLVFDPNTYLMCNNTHFTTLGANQHEDYYFTGTLTSMLSFNMVGNSILNLNTGIVSTQSLNVSGTNNQVTGIGRFIGDIIFANAGTQLTWDVATPLELYTDLSLNGGRIIFTQDSSFIDALTFKTTGTVDLGLYNFYLASSETIWDGNIYWIGNGGSLTFQEDVELTGVWTFSGNIIINGYQKTLQLVEGGKIVIERGANVTFKDILIDYLSADNPIECKDDTCRIVFDYTDMALAGDYSFNKGSFLIYNDTWITSVGDFDQMYTFSYESTKTSTIDEVCWLKVGPRARFSIGRKNSTQTDPTRQSLIFYDASAPLILDDGVLHITSSGMILTKGVLQIEGASSIEVDNTKLDYSLILGDGTVSNDHVLEIGSGAALKIKSGKLVYNNFLDDRIVFDSPSSVLDLEAYQALFPKRSMRLINGSIATPTSTDLFLTPNPYSYVICSNLNRYNYAHTLDYYLTGTIARIAGSRTLVLDSDDQILTNPGTLSVDISVKKSGNLITGVGNVTSKLLFTDSNSTLTWDINRRYAGGNVDLKGGRIIYSQDSGLVAQYSFVGTGTVDLAKQVFELGSDPSIWNCNLYWIGDGGILTLNNNVTLSGTWTFSGDVVIEGNNFLIDLAPSGKLVLERGATVLLKDISLYNVSDQNPIICLDDSCQLSMSIADILMSGDYEFNKGKIFVYWNSTIGRLGDLDTKYTFSYTSAATSTIDSFCTLKIWPRTTFSIGRKDSTITNAENQPLVFVDSTSGLILDGSTLHITSSGAMFTKGVLQITGHSAVEVDNYKDEYGLILGDGTVENDFGCDISGDGGLTLEYGKMIYNSSQPNDRVIFENPNAIFELGAGAVLKVASNLTVEKGYIYINPGALVDFASGTTFLENDMTEYLVDPYNSFKVKGRAKGLLGFELDDGGYFYMLEGMHIGAIQCNAGTTRIGGVAGISDEYFGPITLAGPRSTVELSMVAPLKSDIVLNGGTIVVDSALMLSADRNITGSGEVQLSGRQITFGSEETHLTNTIYWSCSTQGKLDLRAETLFSGNWIVDGKLEINGNGNVLDLSRGGVLTIRPNSTLVFENIALKGVGGNFGNIVWNSDNSLLKLSNAYIELENNFSTTLGGIYVEGPSCVGLGDYNWTIDNRASMTVDGVTLWQDTLDNDSAGAGKILFGSGDQSRYLSLVSSGTIKTAANASTLEIAINEVGSDIQKQMNTIDHGPASIHFVTDSSYTLTYNLDLSPAHFLHVATNTTINGNGFAINLSNVAGNQMIVDANRTVVITNAKINNFSESAFSLGSNSELIFGDGVIVNLDSTQELSRSWLFSGAVAFGNGNIDIDLTPGGNLVVQSGGNLTLQNINITGLKSNNVRCQGNNATLTVENSGLILSSDYSFTSGNIRFVEDVTVCGTNTFVYKPTNVSSGIAPNSTLLLDLGTTFSYAPSSANRDLLGMDDKTACLYLNGCTLSSTITGMRLTKGSLIVDYKNNFRNDGATSVSQGICLGNGTASDDLYIDILSGGSINLLSGKLVYANVN